MQSLKRRTRVPLHISFRIVDLTKDPGAVGAFAKSTTVHPKTKPIRTARFVLAIWLSFVTCGFAQNQSTTETVENASAPAATVSVDDIADDSKIRKRLRKISAAAANAGWLSESEVVIDSGIVTLKGEADMEEHRQWAANVAHKTERVGSTRAWELRHPNRFESTL